MFVILMKRTNGGNIESIGICLWSFKRKSPDILHPLRVKKRSVITAT